MLLAVAKAKVLLVARACSSALLRSMPLQRIATRNRCHSFAIVVAPLCEAARGRSHTVPTLNSFMDAIAAELRFVKA